MFYKVDGITKGIEKPLIICFVLFYRIYQLSAL